ADGSETATTVAPGAPLVLNWEFEPADIVVPAGSRLVLGLGQATSGDGDGFGVTFSVPTSPAPVVVKTGGEASTLTIRTFERGPEAFFETPG
ncbi:MAG: hypothetical protein ACT4PT_12595, partial [Methanobacteriota archaeon]